MFKKFIKKLRNTRKTRIIGIIALIAILSPLVVNTFLTRPKEVEAVWYNDSWKYRKKMIVNQEKVPGGSNFTNFPVLVKITDPDLAYKSQTDGDDILFTDVNAVKLDHEIENYNTATGELTAWVEIPTLYAALNTPFYIYYGNASCASQQNASGAWNSNYIGVWHLKEAVTDELETATHYDSTSPAENGTQKDNDDIDTMLYKGQNFDGSDWINGTDDADLDLTDNAYLSVMAWVKVSSVTAENNIFAKKNLNDVSSGADPGYTFYIDDSTGQLRLDVNDADATPDGYRLQSSTNLSVDTWYHVVFVWDPYSATYAELYINGVDNNATDTCSNCTDITELGTLENALNFVIGAQSDGGSPATGIIDEMRASNIALTADEIATHYNSQSDPASFLSLKTEETRAGNNLYLKFDEGFGTTAQDSSEFNNDGTISGASWQEEGLCVSGKCLRLDGTDDVVTVTNSPAIDFNEGLDTGFTIESWIRVNSDGESSTGEILDKGTNTYIRITNEGTDGLADLEVSLDLATTDATKTVVNGITLNKWHLIAVGYTDDSDDEISIYIDGNLAGTSSNGDGAPATGDTNNLLIGGSSTTNFHGFVDEFKILESERTSVQIKADVIKISTEQGSSASFGPDYSWLSNGLVGYWKMDENTGASTSDSSGNTFTGTLANGAAFTPGKFGFAGSFDGGAGPDADVITVGDQTAYETTTLTISAWIYRTGTCPFSTCSIFSKGMSGNTGYSLALADSSGYKLRLDLRDSLQQITGTTTIGTNTWYHVAASFDGSLVRLYVNGILEGETPQTQTPTFGTEEGKIGNRQSDNAVTFNGKIDEVRVYNHILSPAEINGLYNWAQGPIGWWKFDENTGIDVYDSSGNGNSYHFDGTNPKFIPGKYGSAGNFNGTDNVVWVGDLNNAVDGVSGMTVAAWIYSNDVSQLEKAIARKGYTDNNRWHFDTGGSTSGGGNDLRVEIENDSTGTNRGYTTSDALTSNTWNFVAFVYNGTGSTNTDKLKIYIDGIQRTVTFDGTIASTTDTNADEFEIGKTSVSYWAGGIDDMKIYNYPRTPAQLIEDMNAGHPAPGSPIGSALGEWNFDEGYGDTANNGGSVGSAINGNLGDSTSCPQTSDSACPSWSNSGKIGKALNFDSTAATDDWVSIPDNDSLSFGNSTTDSPFTISAWFNINSLTYEFPIFSKGSNASREYAFYVTDGDKLRMHLFDNNVSNDIYKESSDSLSTGSWHHVVATYSGNSSVSGINIFINGILIPTTTGNTGTYTAMHNQTLGASISRYLTDTTTYADGTIDEVKIFNSALTSDQVKLLFNQGQMAVMGSLSTDSSGNPSWSAGNSYCPPGQTSACVAPIAEWKLDEGNWINDATTRTIWDSSGNGYNLRSGPSGTGPTGGQPGKFGKAGYFDGVNDYIEDNINADLSINLEDFTISTWIKKDTPVDTDVILTKKSSTTIANPGYYFNVNSAGALRFYMSDGTDQFQLSGASSIPINQWVHAEVVVDRDSQANTDIYVNGVRINATPSCSLCATTGTIADVGDLNPVTATDFTIGAQPGGGSSWFTGYIDHVMLYTYYRTPEQVAWDYSKGAPLLHYKFDEGSGSTAYNSATDANDMAAGINGSITSATYSTSGKIGQTLDFDATNDYVSSTNSDPIDQNVGLAQGLTISAWIKPDTDGESDVGRIFTKNTNTWCRTDTESSGKTDLQCSLDLATDATMNVSQALTIGSWNHVAMSWSNDDDDEITLWVNGKIVGTSTDGSGDGSTDTANLIIGNDTTSATATFDGFIDEFKIFNYELTAKQMGTLYNEGALRFY